MASRKGNDEGVVSDSDLKRLQAHDIAVIEEALRKVGAFGEIRLIIENGRLRFIHTLVSESLDKPNSESHGETKP